MSKRMFFNWNKLKREKGGGGFKVGGSESNETQTGYGGNWGKCGSGGSSEKGETGRTEYP